MKNNLAFDFIVDKAKKTINVTREFAADVDLVWQAWTTPEILEKWWAPKPFVTKTKFMDFREGGHWLYAMVGPDNTTHWCRADYEKITPLKNYSGLDAFCDEHGTINPEFPRTLWSVTFNQTGETTTVHVVNTFNALEDIEKIIQMGFKEGFSMALGNLDQYLEAQFKLRNEMKKENVTRICTYLNFPGNAEEAFSFYKKVFKTDFPANGLQRFGDLPANADHPPLAESVKKMILHIELPILGCHVLMGTDAPKEMGFTVAQGNNMHISIEPETKDETTRIFNELSEGGTITMPLQDMFWGAYYASFTDKFGINWMLNYINKK